VGIFDFPCEEPGTGRFLIGNWETRKGKGYGARSNEGKKYPNGVGPRIKNRGRQDSFSKKNERGTNKAPPDVGAWVPDCLDAAYEKR
jgi:hypothetical protein